MLSGPFGQSRQNAPRRCEEARGRGGGRQTEDTKPRRTKTEEESNTAAKITVNAGRFGSLLFV